jgi:hypothetical protein
MDFLVRKHDGHQAVTYMGRGISDNSTLLRSTLLLQRQKARTGSNMCEHSAVRMRGPFPQSPEPLAPWCVKVVMSPERGATNMWTQEPQSDRRSQTASARPQFCV